MTLPVAGDKVKTMPSFVLFTEQGSRAYAPLGNSLATKLQSSNYETDEEYGGIRAKSIESEFIIQYVIY